MRMEALNFGPHVRFGNSQHLNFRSYLVGSILSGNALLGRPAGTRKEECWLQTKPREITGTTTGLADFYLGNALIFSGSSFRITVRGIFLLACEGLGFRRS